MDTLNKKKNILKNLKVSSQVHKQVKKFVADADLKIKDFIENLVIEHIQKIKPGLI